MSEPEVIDIDHNGQALRVIISPINRTELDRRSELERLIVSRIISNYISSKARIVHAPSGRPLLENADGLHISISHSADYVAVVFGPIEGIGIDVEQPRTQLARVAPRVLSGAEMAVYGRSESLLLRAWTLKEALYKAALTEGVDFRRDIVLPLSPDDTRATVCDRPFDIIHTDETAERIVSLVAAR